MSRNQSEPTKRDEKTKGKKTPTEIAVDDQIEDSFPASDPPSQTDPSRSITHEEPAT